MLRKQLNNTGTCNDVYTMMTKGEEEKKKPKQNKQPPLLPPPKNNLEYPAAFCDQRCFHFH